MGVARAIVKLLMREGNREAFSGNVLTAGRQDVYATADTLRKWAKEMNFKLKPGVEIQLSDNDEFRKKGYISDKTLFLSLGFDKVDSIDYSSHEQCTIVHDLNDNVPDEYHNKYDLIFDGGTSEHIFNFPKTLDNFNTMCKVGGRIIHALPSSNHVDHGLYLFSPTLFVDYYSSNKWNIIDILFFRYVPSSHIPKYFTRRWNIYSYAPDSLYGWIFGGYKGMYGIVSITQKTNMSTFDASVQQRGFLKKLNIASNKDEMTPEMKDLLNKKTFLQKALMSKILTPKLRDIIRPLYYKVACKIPLKYHLKLVARY